MNAERILQDKNFISYALSKVPGYLKYGIPKDDIESELNLVILLCAKSFDPKRGSFMNFVIRSLNNNLHSLFNRTMAERYREVPLECAIGKTYEEDKDGNGPLIAYFKTLPRDLVEKLTDFALGKIKKEDISCPPSCLTSEEVGRIIDKIDSMV